ncbi:hypothetical protein QJS64_02500 [Paraclostridium bifermentans]|uniref:Alpha/beta hydrolase n=1 Tax=Paraclostridium bifermentans TaxID=1490 RepID=A0ABY8R3Y4_PARBF|nr:hypothetical protein QJS64_02500 [Paraclostridium bifermentans]
MNSFKLKSSYTNSFYDIDLYIPKESNDTALPLIIVLDGGNNFDIVKSCVKQQGQLYIKTGVKNSIVLGISHEEHEKKKKDLQILLLLLKIMYFLIKINLQFLII